MTLESIRKEAEKRELEERRKYDDRMFKAICGGAIVLCLVFWGVAYLICKYYGK